MCRLNEILALLINIADAECLIQIGMKATLVDGDINIDDVTIFELTRIWNSLKQ